MLLKDKNGYYAKATELDDGSIVRYLGHPNKQMALLEVAIVCNYKNRQEMESKGWQEIPPESIEDCTGGEVLTDRDGDEQKVLLRLRGVGDGTVLLLSGYRNFNNAGPLYTAKELKDSGYTIASQPTITKEEAEKRLGLRIE